MKKKSISVSAEKNTFYVKSIWILEHRAVLYRWVCARKSSTWERVKSQQNRSSWKLSDDWVGVGKWWKVYSCAVNVVVYYYFEVKKIRKNFHFSLVFIKRLCSFIYLWYFRVMFYQLWVLLCLLTSGQSVGKFFIF